MTPLMRAAERLASTVTISCLMNRSPTHWSDESDDLGRTALHWAARAGDIEAVLLLLAARKPHAAHVVPHDHDAEANDWKQLAVPDDYGDTAAHEAARWGRGNIVQMCVRRYPACLEIPNAAGEYPEAVAVGQAKWAFREAISTVGGAASSRRPEV